MINNFKKTNIDKDSELNEYNKVFDIFIEDYNKNKTDIKKYTKSIMLNNELLYSTIIRDKYYNSIIVLIEGSDFKINISLFDDKDIGFEYVFNLKRKFTDNTKIYDIEKVCFKKEDEGNSLEVNLYNFEKKDNVYNIFEKIEFNIKQSSFDFYYKLKQGLNIFDYNNNYLDREEFLTDIEDFIDKKDVRIYDNMKIKIGKEQDLEYFKEIKNEKNEEKFFLYTLDNIDKNLKEFINIKFEKITKNNNIFNFDNYRFIDGTYYNIYNPNIYFGKDSEDIKYIFTLEDEYEKYLISYYNLEKIGIDFNLENIINLEFGVFYINEEDSIFEVMDKNNTQVAFYNPQDMNTDYIGTYNDFINKIIKKYNFKITSLKEIIIPEGKIKDIFELGMLQNDYNDLDKIQEPLEKLRKNLSIQINKPNIKLKAKNVK